MRQEKEHTSWGKRVFIYSAVVVMMALGASAHAVVEGNSNVAFGADWAAPDGMSRLIIKYKSQYTNRNLSPAAVRSLSQRSGESMRYMRRLATGAHVMRFQRGMSTAQLSAVMQRLMANTDIEYVEVDRLMQPMFTPNDSRYNEQWHYYEAAGGLNLPSAWDVSDGANAVVAVIDTGIRPHADLAANLLPGYDMIQDSDIAQDGDGRDADASDPGDWAPWGACGFFSPGSDSSWHGTHVAGTIAAQTNNGIGVAGVAYAAQVVPVRVLGRCGGYTSDIAEGIIWAAGGNVSGVPSNPNPAQVINLSLGGSGSCGATTQNAINTARALGATVVVAAGNANQDASSSTPANCDGVVTVAATNRDGGRASYSNYGSVVDIAAPGGQTSSGIEAGILSTLDIGTQGPAGDGYAFYQGTSMATPHVAGVVALMYALDPLLAPSDVESVLKSTARSFPGSCAGCGAGIVDASAAVAAVDVLPTPTPTPTISPSPTPTATPTPTVTPTPTATPTPLPSCSDVSTYNYYHYSAGRASREASGFWWAPSYTYRAEGSDDVMPGSTWSSNTLRSFNGNYWELGACP